MNSLIEELQKIKDLPLPAHFDKWYNTMSFFAYEMATLCPQKFKAIRIDRIGKPVDSRAAIEGSVLHSVLEHFFKSDTRDLQWIVDNLPLEFKTLLPTFKIIHWRTKDPRVDQQKCWESIQNQVNWVIRWLDQSKVHLRKEVHPEDPFKARIWPDMYISGRIDLWSVNEDTGLIEIHDWKGVISEDKPKRAQIIMYSLGLLGTQLRPVWGGSFVCTLLQKLLPFPVTEQDLIDFRKTLKGVNDGINLRRERKFFEPRKNSLCRYCGIYDQCNFSVYHPKDKMGQLDWSDL